MIASGQIDPETFFCAYCSGTGRTDATVPDAEIGQTMRALRRRYQISAVRVADKLGLGEWMLGEFECGRQPWTLDLVKRYKAAIRVIVGGEL